MNFNATGRYRFSSTTSTSVENWVPDGFVRMDGSVVLRFFFVAVIIHVKKNFLILQL